MVGIVLKAIVFQLNIFYRQEDIESVFTIVFQLNIFYRQEDIESVFNV